MKKSLAIILAILMLLPCFFTAAFAGILDDEDIEYGVAEGYVRTKEVFRNNEGETTTTATAYNSDGLKVKTVQVSQSDYGYSKTTTAYAYNSNWNLVKEVESRTASDGFTAKKVTVYTYDKAGYLTKITTSDRRSDGYYDYYGKTTTAYSYNSVGNPVKIAETTKDNDGTSKEIHTFTYDKKNNLTKEVQTNAEGGRTVRKAVTTCSYDKYGYLYQVIVDDTWTTEDYNEYSVTTYTNDRGGRVLKEEYSNIDSRGSGYQEFTTYTYNSKGFLSKKTKNHYQGTTFSTTETTSYTHDKNGNVTKETVNYRSNDNGDIYSFKQVITYTYDKAGNLLKVVDVLKNSYGTVFKEVRAYKYKQMWAY